MCGNVGILLLDNKVFLTNKECKFFEQALHVDALRGVDATGIAIINSSGDIETQKKAVPSQIFLRDKTLMYKINAGSVTALLGHNRWATTGSLDDTGAHPFTHGDITLFHNGTLNSWYNLSKGTFKIDSEAICAGISENGAKATLEKLNGAYALVWYNKKDSTVNFARNKERPLYFGTIKNRKVLMYASEKGMIEWLADRNGIALESVDQLEVGKILSINIKTSVKPSISSFKVLENTQFNSYYGSYYDYEYDYKDSSYNGSTIYSKSKKTNPLSKAIFKNIKVVFDVFKSYQNGRTIEKNKNLYSSFKKNIDNTSKVFGYVEGRYTDINGEIHKVKAAGISEEEADLFLTEAFTICRITTISNDSEAAFVKRLNKTELSSLDIEKSLKETDDILREKDTSNKKELVTTSKKKNFIGPNGANFNIQLMSLTTKKGCKTCKCKIDLEDFYSYVWIQNKIYCFDCFTNEVC